MSKKANAERTEDMDEKDQSWFINHEKRITTLETLVSGISGKMEKLDRMENTLDSVQTQMQQGNSEQKQLLDTLITHHLETKKIKLNKFWQVVINATGAGGLAAAVVYAIVQAVQHF